MGHNKKKENHILYHTHELKQAINWVSHKSPEDVKRAIKELHNLVRHKIKKLNYDAT